MKLTIDSVKKMDACAEAIVWAENIWNGKEENAVKVIKRLMDEEKYDWQIG